MLKTISCRVGLYAPVRTVAAVKVSCTGQPPPAGSCQSWETPGTLVRKETKRPSGANEGPEAARMLRKRSMPKRGVMAVLRGGRLRCADHYPQFAALRPQD